MLPRDEPTSYVDGDLAPNLDDARRRLVLALRGLTVQKQRQERSDAAVAEWTATLDREITAYRYIVRRNRLRRAAKWIAFAAVLLGLARVGHGAWQVFFVFMLFKGARDVKSSTRTQTATALARARDPRAVNVLAKAARDGDKETKAIAEQGLRSILPSLRASDREFINDEGMRALIDLLRPGLGLNPGVALAILTGLQQVGDGRAVPSVEELLAWLESPRAYWFLSESGAGRMDPVVLGRAAEECLRALQVRAENDRLRTTLLRPASAPDNAAQILLRPAGGVPTGAPELLLRPVMPEDNEVRLEQGTLE